MTNAELSVSQLCFCVGPHDFVSRSKYNWFDFVTKWSPFRGRGRKPTPESTQRGTDLGEVKYFWNFNLNWIWWWLADSAILHCALYHLSIWELWSLGMGGLGPGSQAPAPATGNWPEQLSSPPLAQIKSHWNLIIKISSASQIMGNPYKRHG